ncbi:MAG TPA: helix-turn-helix domain-containing protein [Acidimicrobiales bacterium]|nr:helix-turn-helix domain-containing protein [Acidimicrobiales bacterium]
MHADAPSPAPLSPADFSSAVTAITSAFGDPTRREIYLWLRDHPAGATAAAVAERFELHANVARHHLDKLAAGGYLEVTTSRAAGGGAGRPSKRYTAVASENPIEFAVRHDDLLVSLLGKSLALLPDDVAARMAEEVGIEYGRALAASLGSQESAQRSFRSALHAVADALSAHGFAAHAEKQGDELRIVAQHCPFGGAAIEHPVICAVDRGLVKGMLSSLYGDTRPATETTQALGSETCVTVVTTGS